MNRLTMFTLFYLASFLQAGAYGLTFMLPRLFEGFGANEKIVGVMLFLTTISTLITVYYAGHLSDRFGRVRTLGVACLAIATALAAYGLADGIGGLLILASVALGAGWGLTYALSPIVLTRLVTPDERVRYFAILSVALMAGFGLSPVMASMMESAELIVNDAFFLTAVLCAVAGVIFLVIIAPVRTHSAASGPEPRSSLSLAAVRAIMGSRARLPVIMVCLGASVFAGMNNFQTVIADERGIKSCGLLPDLHFDRGSVSRGLGPVQRRGKSISDHCSPAICDVWLRGSVPRNWRQLADVSGRRFLVRHWLWRQLSDPCRNGGE